MTAAVIQGDVSNRKEEIPIFLSINNHALLPADVALAVSGKSHFGEGGNELMNAEVDK